MAYFGIAQRTAGDYIRRARERGFLGPAVGRGQPGEKTVDAAVSEDVSSSPDPYPSAGREG